MSAKSWLVSPCNTFQESQRPCLVLMHLQRLSFKQPHSGLVTKFSIPYLRKILQHKEIRNVFVWLKREHRQHFRLETWRRSAVLSKTLTFSASDPIGFICLSNKICKHSHWKTKQIKKKRKLCSLQTISYVTQQLMTQSNH